jgi:hypothetical protein
MNAKLLIVAALSFTLSIATIFADDEAANRPVVRASEYGGMYGKSVPEENYGQKGQTSVFSVGAERDVLVYKYPWYANIFYIGGSEERTLIRFGPWQRGRNPQKDHLALGIYRDGKTVKEYSTLEIVNFGSGISTSVSHYKVFGRHLGFRWLKENSYVYEVEGVSGKVFTFDLETGLLAEKNSNSR